MADRNLPGVDMNSLIDRLYTLAVTCLGEGSTTESLVERVFLDGWDDEDSDASRTEERLVREFYRRIVGVRFGAEAEDSSVSPDPVVALRSFPAETAVPLLLVDLFGWSYSRVSRALEVDAETVNELLGDARRKLKEVLLRLRD
jgi:hypothetical protein